MDSRLEAIEELLNINELRKAEVTIAKLLRDDLPSRMRAQVLLRRARVRLLGGRPDDALEELQTSLAIAQNLEETPAVKALMGDIYFARFVLAEFGFADRTDANRALEYYNEILTRFPNYGQKGWIYYQRGRIYLSEDRIDDAIKDFETALQCANQPPSLHAFCHERLGFIWLFEKRDPDIAIACFNRAVEAHPSGRDAGWLVHVHVLRSRALRETGNNHAALEAASQALDSLDPSAPDYRQALTEAHLAVGEVLALISGREAEALEHLLQFLQTSKRPLGVDVTWSRVHETIGDLSFKLERFEQAVEAYQSSLTFNPYHPWQVNVYYQIARSYYQMRAYERVIAAVDKMLTAAAEEQQAVTDYRVYYVLANAHFALEHYEKAAEAYENAMQFAPANAAKLNKIKKYLRFSKELAAD